MIGGTSGAAVTIQDIRSQPWSSLTFTGTRHRLVVRLPAGAATGGEIDGAGIALPDAIVAVERAIWAGPQLTVDLIVIDADRAGQAGSCGT